MFFIHHDQTQILERREKCRPGPDDHPRPTLPDLMPGFSPLGRCLGAMEHAEPHPLPGQTTPKSGHRLGRQRNLRNQHHRVAPLRQHRL